MSASLNTFGLRPELDYNRNQFVRIYRRRDIIWEKQRKISKDDGNMDRIVSACVSCQKRPGVVVVRSGGDQWL